jgi:uncharacterized repeat protein (TIGR01451 family)
VVCTGSYTVQQADADNGSVVNTASADSNETPQTSDTVTTPVGTTPEITLVKARTDSTSPIVDGSVLDYQITATNTGGVTLTNVTLIDSLIAGLVCLPALPVVTLAPGDSVVCAGSYMVTAGDVSAGQVVNTATVNSDQGASDIDSVTTTIGGTVPPAIPMLDGLAVLLLALLLVGVGLKVLGRAAT